MTPSVKLINVTANALDMLIMAKSTRLEMRPGLFDEIKARPYEEKMKEVEYISNTIPSSWEFVHFTFTICDVTRAFTHQLVRTRTASYAQQAMRIADMSVGFKYATGPTIVDELNLSFPSNKEMYDDCMENIKETYAMLVKNGAKVEDARGILPTNIGTNIMTVMNLRTFTDLCHKRSSSRVQDEYREVVRQMKEEVLAAEPWVKNFIDRTFDRAAADLDAMIRSELPKEKADKAVKLLDQMRMQS